MIYTEISVTVIYLICYLYYKENSVKKSTQKKIESITERIRRDIKLKESTGTKF